MGKQTQSELRSHYVVLLAHLLKRMIQPEQHGNSWRYSIAGQRDDIAEHLRKNPSLKASDEEIFAGAYRRARIEAARQTRLRLESFPAEPPFTADQARSDDFWPENA